MNAAKWYILKYSRLPYYGFMKNKKKLGLAGYLGCN